MAAAPGDGDDGVGPSDFVAPRRVHASTLPATGAWREGDLLGDRKRFTLGRPFALEGGGVLPELTLAYETWGTLAPDGRNAVLVCLILFAVGTLGSLVGAGINLAMADSEDALSFGLEALLFACFSLYLWWVVRQIQRNMGR